MSRLTSMSAEAIKQMFSPDADSDLITLLTFIDEETSDVLARIADNYTQRISEDSEDVMYGVVSNGNSFNFLPITVSLPTEDGDQAPRCSIVIHNATRYLTPIIRSLSAPPKVIIQLVLSKTPDTVEIEFTDFFISNFTYNRDQVTADLSMIDLEREPFPQHSFTPQYFPGMF